MKSHRILITVACGLLALALIVGVPFQEQLGSDASKLRYNLLRELLQAAAILLLLVYLWLSGTLLATHKRLSIAMLLAALIPIAIMAGVGISENYQAVHAASVRNSDLRGDSF
jgi:small-conductance mechanosensitive channel